MDGSASTTIEVETLGTDSTYKLDQIARVVADVRALSPVRRRSVNVIDLVEELEAILDGETRVRAVSQNVER